MLHLTLPAISLSPPQMTPIRGQKKGCSQKKWEAMVRQMASERLLDPRPILSGDRRSHNVAVRWTIWRILVADGFSYKSIADSSGFDHSAIKYGVKPHMAAAKKARGKYLRESRC